MPDARVISTRFPYLPVTVSVRHRTEQAEALLDTGFDGFIAVPPRFVTNGREPESRFTYTLADGTMVTVPVYRGEVTIGSFGPYRTIVTVIGDEVIVGRRLMSRFLVTLDHGDRVIVDL
jgi:predicted aspartyl protease